MMDPLMTENGKPRTVESFTAALEWHRKFEPDENVTLSPMERDELLALFRSIEHSKSDSARLDWLERRHGQAVFSALWDAGHAVTLTGKLRDSIDTAMRDDGCDVPKPGDAEAALDAMTRNAEELGLYDEPQAGGSSRRTS